MMFLDRPAYLDEQGSVRCGLPAEVRCRFIMRSTDGPLESAMIRYAAGHWFDGPIESLTWDSTGKHALGTAGVAASARRDSLKGGDGRDGGGRFVVRDFPGEREQAIARPNGAPAYYLGRPACVWITAMSPRHRRKPQANAQTMKLAAGSVVRGNACAWLTRNDARSPQGGSPGTTFNSTNRLPNARTLTGRLDTPQVGRRQNNLLCAVPSDGSEDRPAAHIGGYCRSIGTGAEHKA
jgi:hypothetical protein